MFVCKHSWPHLAVIAPFLHCLVFAGTMRAQDTLHLTEVQVSAGKINFGATGKKEEVLDSVTLMRFQTQSLAQVLNSESSMHIKSYGPGALATSAFRGGSAAHTAVVWNGINIQSRMLGQLDLSLLPAFLFDAVTIQYGSSSALWGSGAVAGSVLLDSKSTFAKGRNILLTGAAGSFGNSTFGFKYKVSTERWASATKVWWRQSRNDFRYQLEDTSAIVRAKNAAYDMKGLQQEVRYKISSGQFISFNAWLSSGDRQLPSFQGTRESKAIQKDQNHRFVVDYERHGDKTTSHLKAAFLREGLDYTDSLSGIFSISKVNTFLVESDNYYRWQKHLFNFGLSATSSQARSTAYDGLRDLSFLSMLAGNKFFFFANRLQLQAQLRQDFYYRGQSPFTFNLGADQKLSQTFSAHLNIAKVFRHPTLNEWYWQPGGNPALLPEQGYSAEGHLQFKKSSGFSHILITAAGFSRQIDNWILWVPGAGGNPSPRNLQKVWSRGTESSARYTWRREQLMFALAFRTAYVLSTVQTSVLREDASLNKQLIYTPRYTGNGTFSLQYKKLRVDYTQQYCGYRFTSSDNGEWLNPFWTADVRASLFLDTTQRYCFTLSCNNLYNQVYAVVQGRPASLRYYEISFIWQPKI